MNKKPENTIPEKPKLKKKLPPVKQTLTSIYRRVRADPLLIEKDQSVKVPHGSTGRVVLPDKVLVWNNKAQSTTSSHTQSNNVSSQFNQNSFITSFTRPADISSNTLCRRNTIATCKPRPKNCLNHPTNYQAANKNGMIKPTNLHINKPILQTSTKLTSQYVNKSVGLSNKDKQTSLQTNSRSTSLQTTSKPSSQANNKPSLQINNKTSLQTSNRPNLLTNSKPSLYINSKPSLLTNNKPAPTKQATNKNPCMLPPSKNCLPPQFKRRRSLSAQHFDRKKGLPKTQPEQNIIKAEITQSMEDITQNSLSHIEEVSSNQIKKTVTFKTPELHRRRSIINMTPLKSFTQQPQSTPQLATVADLPRRLNEWLTKRGRSLTSYHHLKCFGLHAHVETENDRKNTPVKKLISKAKQDVETVNENDKENTPTKNLINNIRQEVEIVEEKDAVNDNKIVKDALEDLHKLITESYPLDQCENWLGAIRLKYRQIEEEPQYWECRAAIEQERGNISVAVECYKTAIIKGAEINHVDESLDRLLETFSLLNIDTTVSKAKKSHNVKEVCNIFKSSIIQFAVQERSKKLKVVETEERQYMATPVRRSTRLSRSAYVSTPKIMLCNSLHELETSIQESISFQKNAYLK